MMTDEQNTARKLRAILSADVEGYSLLMADDEAGTVERLVASRIFRTFDLVAHRLSCDFFFFKFR